MLAIPVELDSGLRFGKENFADKYVLARQHFEESCLIKLLIGMLFGPYFAILKVLLEYAEGQEVWLDAGGHHFAQSEAVAGEFEIMFILSEKLIKLGNKFLGLHVVEWVTHHAIKLVVLIQIARLLRVVLEALRVQPGVVCRFGSTAFGVPPVSGAAAATETCHEVF